jgi:hypothetical protein
VRFNKISAYFARIWLRRFDRSSSGILFLGTANLKFAILDFAKKPIDIRLLAILGTRLVVRIPSKAKSARQKSFLSPSTT